MYRLGGNFFLFRSLLRTDNRINGIYVAEYLNGFLDRLSCIKI